MQLQRLVVEDADNPLAVDIHPGLTVVVLADDPSRRRFVADLVGGLGPGRPGVHVELVDHAGRALVVFRPAGARHRVIDTASGLDVSDEFAVPGGAMDPLTHAGLDPSAAWHGMRLGADGLGAVAAAPDAPAANRADDPAVVADREVDEAARSHRTVLRLGLIVAAACAVVGVVLLALDDVVKDDRWTAKALFVLAALALVLALTDRRRLVAARRRRRRLPDAAPRSDVPGTPQQPAASVGRSVAEAAALLAARVDSLRAVGPHREPVPLVLDEPFAACDRPAAELLEVVRRLAAEHQTVLVSGDPDVARWGRQLAGRGQAAVVAPTAPRPTTPPGPLGTPSALRGPGVGDPTDVEGLRDPHPAASPSTPPPLSRPTAPAAPHQPH